MMLRSRAADLRRSAHEWLAHMAVQTGGAASSGSGAPPADAPARAQAAGGAADSMDTTTLLAIASVLRRRLVIFDWLPGRTSRRQGTTWKVLGTVYPLQTTYAPHRAEWRHAPLLLGMREPSLFFEMRLGRRGCRIRGRAAAR